VIDGKQFGFSNYELTPTCRLLNNVVELHI
jgi:hypothetical protein